MIVFRRLRTFFSLSTKGKFLFLETLFFLAFGRVLKIFPFKRIAPSLGVSWEETDFSVNPARVQVLRQISESINILSRYTFWESQCLVKAIAGMKMLERRNIESTLYLGTAKDKDGRLIAHAWLRSGPLYITGFEGKDKYTVVGTFAKRPSVKNFKGENNG